jgi:glycosyltransferase involved in cell wall biosynthesis
MRVCHVTCGHSPTDGRIFQRECRTLASRYEVFLIAPNTEDFEKDGVNIKGVRINGGKIGKLFHLRPFLQKAIEIDADVYQFHEPELLPIGRKLKRRGKKVIFDSHEDAPQQLSEKAWIPSIIRKPLAEFYARYEKLVLKHFDAVVSVTPSIVERLKRINPSTYMITNYPEFKEIEDRRKFGPYVCFAGGISPQWMHDVVVESLDGLNVHYLLAGKVQNKSFFEKLKQNPNWPKVVFKGLLPHNEVGRLMEDSSAGIALNDYVANVGYKMGSLGNTKLFEYMMAGIPVIATDFMLWKKIVETYDCGTCVNPHDSRAIRTAIDFYINHPEEARRQGDNGRRAVKEKYCWATQIPVLFEMYDNVIANE